MQNVDPFGDEVNKEEQENQNQHNQNQEVEDNQQVIDEQQQPVIEAFEDNQVVQQSNNPSHKNLQNNSYFEAYNINLRNLLMHEREYNEKDIESSNECVKRDPPNSLITQQRYVTSLDADSDKGLKRTRAEDINNDGMDLDNLNRNINSVLIRLAKEIQEGEEKLVKDKSIGQDSMDGLFLLHGQSSGKDKTEKTEEKNDQDADNAETISAMDAETLANPSNQVKQNLI